MASPDAVEAAYTRWAPRYDADRNLTRDLDAACTREALAGLAVGVAVEAGCGTGKNTPFLAGLARQLLAFDFAEAMLDRARARVAAGGLDHVVLRRHDLLQPWPVAAGTAGLVCLNLVLEHVADLDAAFAHAAAACAPGASVWVTELHPERQARGSRARFDDGGGEVHIPAHPHALDDYLQAAARAGLQVVARDARRHAQDAPDAPPRLLTLRFRAAPDAA